MLLFTIDINDLDENVRGLNEGLYIEIQNAEFILIGIRLKIGL